MHIKKQLEATSGVLVQNEQRLTRSAAGVSASAATGERRGRGGEGAGAAGEGPFTAVYVPLTPEMGVASRLAKAASTAVCQTLDQPP